EDWPCWESSTRSLGRGLSSPAPARSTAPWRGPRRPPRWRLAPADPCGPQSTGDCAALRIRAAEGISPANRFRVIASLRAPLVFTSTLPQGQAAAQSVEARPEDFRWREHLPPPR